MAADSAASTQQGLDFQLEFEGEGAGEGQCEIPLPSTPPRPNPSGTTPRRLKRRRDPHELLVEGCPVKMTQCLLCECPCYRKSRFCKDHKKDAEACKRDAEQQGQLEFYNRQAESADLLRKMVQEYAEKCKSRGPGAKRDRFDWVSYQEKTFKQKLMRKGQTLVHCFEHFLYKQHPQPQLLEL